MYLNKHLNQNKMKQTAVEWLVEKFNQCEPMYSGIQSADHKQYLDSLIEQAKEMEKEQIIKAHGIQTFKSIKQGIDFWDVKTGEQYYNETYKKY